MGKRVVLMVLINTGIAFANCLLTMLFLKLGSYCLLTFIAATPLSTNVKEKKSYKFSSCKEGTCQHCTKSNTHRILELLLIFLVLIVVGTSVSVILLRRLPEKIYPDNGSPELQIKEDHLNAEEIKSESDKLATNLDRGVLTVLQEALKANHLLVPEGSLGSYGTTVITDTRVTSTLKRDINQLFGKFKSIIATLDSCNAIPAAQPSNNRNLIAAFSPDLKRAINERKCNMLYTAVDYARYSKCGVARFEKVCEYIRSCEDPSSDYNLDDMSYCVTFNSLSCSDQLCIVIIPSIAELIHKKAKGTLTTSEKECLTAKVDSVRKKETIPSINYILSEAKEHETTQLYIQYRPFAPAVLEKYTKIK